MDWYAELYIIQVSCLMSTAPKSCIFSVKAPLERYWISNMVVKEVLSKMITLPLTIFIIIINPITFTRVVGKVRKTIFPRRKEGRVGKSARSVPRRGAGGPGLEPRTYIPCRRGSPAQLHARELFWQVSLSVASRAIAQHHVRRVLEIVSVRFCKI